ncbi:MAG: ester cyclase [Chloroflexi bacterium]|nr:ester cyclase [Chloroflexota bacterium]
MSVQETTRIDDAVIAAWNAHDADKFVSYCADDITWYDVTTPQPLKGKDGARQFFQGWVTAFPDLNLRVKNRLVTEDQVADEIEFSGTDKGPIQGPPGTPPLPATGKKVTNAKGTYFSRIRDGKVVEVHTYPDMAGLLMQLGMMPSAPQGKM